MNKHTVLDLINVVGRDGLATSLSLQEERMNDQREKWLQEKKELRDYLFATSTKTTSNSSLPWKNSTTVPKLTQIRDNIHANYMAALFPNEDFFRWEGDNNEAEVESKRKVITSYMQNKILASDFKSTVSALVFDYIDYGNAFATVEWVKEEVIDEETGEPIRGYIGPKLVRISPNDIVFNPAASTFQDSPKFIRSVVTLGEIKLMAEKDPLDEDAQKLAAKAVEKAVGVRKQLASSMGTLDKRKKDAFRIDGFGSLEEYFNSGFVEVLDFFGTAYDVENDTMMENYHIRVIDRSFVLFAKPRKQMVLNTQFFHAGWRLRPDNLYAMGPLDNLVGMQYRIDHLENLRADVFDLIAFPVLKIRGEVQDFNWGPMERIYVGDDSDVTFLVPDTAALNADFQIDRLFAMMEELAGAPKQAMGIRTPGEKTAFEVQTLDNSANRIFNEKAMWFEQHILLPALNGMLVLARHKLDEADIIRTIDDELGAAVFKTITKDDLKTSGTLRPVGASDFAKRANTLQNLVQFLQTVGQDPAIAPHISGLKAAQIGEDLLNLNKFDLVEKDIRIHEQADTARAAQSAQENVEVEGLIPAGITADEFGEV